MTVGYSKEVIDVGVTIYVRSSVEGNGLGFADRESGAIREDLGLVELKST